MEKARHSVQFQTTVQEDGRITFSRPVHGLRLMPGSAVTVKIFGGVLSPTLRRLRVTEEEVELIGSVQMEDREQVMKFLSSQGALRTNRRFRQRIDRATR